MFLNNPAQIFFNNIKFKFLNFKFLKSQNKNSTCLCLDVPNYKIAIDYIINFLYTMPLYHTHFFFIN